MNVEGQKNSLGTMSRCASRPSCPSRRAARGSLSQYERCVPRARDCRCTSSCCREKENHRKIKEKETKMFRQLVSPLQSHNGPASVPMRRVPLSLCTGKVVRNRNRTTVATEHLRTTLQVRTGGRVRMFNSLLRLDHNRWLRAQKIALECLGVDTDRFYLRRRSKRISSAQGMISVPTSTRTRFSSNSAYNSIQNS